MFNNIKDAIYWLENIKRKEKRTDLSRITNILNDFDNPQDSFTKVHVAGTNGKGSVCHILNSCLKSKYTTGVFSSPYIVSFNERIKINDKFIDDESLLNLINLMFDYSSSYELKNSDIIPFFEICFVISLLYFKEQKVDVAIIEVGVGGLLDCTNCFNYDVSLITNIGYDHVDYLGNTKESIADHKLGILKENNILYTTVNEELHKYFKKYSRGKKIKINFINTLDIKNISLDINNTCFTYNDFNFKTSMIGLNQVYNSALAISVLNDFFQFSYFEINKLISNISFAGRFEILQNNPLFIADGAHNIDGIKSLIDSVKLLFNKKVHFCFAAMKDKDVSNMINLMEDVAQTISFTQINYYRTTQVDDFKSNLDNVFYYEKIEDALNSFKNLDSNEIVIFTGSLYFISEIRKYF